MNNEVLTPTSKTTSRGVTHKLKSSHCISNNNYTQSRYCISFIANFQKNISDCVLFIESGEGAGAGVLDGFLFWRIGYWASFISRDIEFRAGF